MHDSHDITSVSDSDLACLVMWPDGTVGYDQEARIVKILNGLCREFGYGRIPQLAREIEDIWRNPERIDHYHAVREEHLKFMRECQS